MFFMLLFAEWIKMNDNDLQFKNKSIKAKERMKCQIKPELKVPLDDP